MIGVIKPPSIATATEISTEEFLCTPFSSSQMEFDSGTRCVEVETVRGGREGELTRLPTRVEQGGRLRESL